MNDIQTSLNAETFDRSPLESEKKRGGAEMQREIESPLLTRKQAAAYLNISIATLDRKHELPRVKLFGKTVMYEKAVLNHQIEKNRIPGIPRQNNQELAGEVTR